MSWTDGALDADSAECVSLDADSAVYGYDPEDATVRYMVMTPVAAAARR